MSDGAPDRQLEQRPAAPRGADVYAVAAVSVCNKIVYCCNGVITLDNGRYPPFRHPGSTPGTRSPRPADVSDLVHSCPYPFCYGGLATSTRTRARQGDDISPCRRQRAQWTAVAEVPCAVETTGKETTITELPPDAGLAAAGAVPVIAPFGQLLSGSYRRLVGASLLSPDVAQADASRWLYEDAPFALLAQDMSADPKFVYANRTAQQQFEYSWDEFIGLPSRLSAETPERDEREESMQRVRLQGYAVGYRGVRVAKSGRRFWIEDATVWNLVDRDGSVQGQAAVIGRWSDV